MAKSKPAPKKALLILPVKAKMAGKMPMMEKMGKMDKKKDKKGMC